MILHEALHIENLRGTWHCHQKMLLKPSTIPKYLPCPSDNIQLKKKKYTLIIPKPIPFIALYFWTAVSTRCSQNHRHNGLFFPSVYSMNWKGKKICLKKLGMKDTCLPQLQIYHLSVFCGNFKPCLNNKIPASFTASLFHFAVSRACYGQKLFYGWMGIGEATSMYSSRKLSWPSTLQEKKILRLSRGQSGFGLEVPGSCS